MVGYVATGFIFAVLESPKSFPGTRHVEPKELSNNNIKYSCERTSPRW